MTGFHQSSGGKRCVSSASSCISKTVRDERRSRLQVVRGLSFGQVYHLRGGSTCLDRLNALLRVRFHLIALAGGDDLAVGSLEVESNASTLEASSRMVARSRISCGSWVPHTSAAGRAGRRSRRPSGSVHVSCGLGGRCGDRSPGALGEEAHAVESDDDGGSFVPGDAKWQG